MSNTDMDTILVVLVIGRVILPSVRPNPSSAIDLGFHPSTSGSTPALISL
jgi:hypothetical protein